jgi:GTP pyrophosphokinase
VAAYAPGADLDLIMRAYFYAAKAHKDQSRKSGEAYFTHPLAVAGILSEQKLDIDSIATALLHDTIEDTMATKEELAELFSPTIAELVDGVTKIGKLEFRSKEEAAAENFRKMLLAMSRDVRVILVKLADRIHNMRTLGSMREEKQRRIAQETQDIFVPLANRMGILAWRQELDNLCLRYLHPDVHGELSEQMAQTEEQREAYIRNVGDGLRDILAERGIPATVYGRVKHLASIYRKMCENHLEFEQVHDLFAFRVLVDDLAGCYGVLGHVHGLYPPVPDRIKDYIAMPKTNGYQSLHTTVVGPQGHRFEVQIRTHEMHDVAERGVAAHWQYKEGHLALSSNDVAGIHRLREVLESAQEVEDPDEFMEAVKIDLFHNEVYVFTPKGDVREFPSGATVLDFAYAIHSKLGDTCVGGRVNGKLVPLRYKLKSGDHLEVVTRKDQHPRRDWLEFAKTSKAISKIRRHLRLEERATGVRMGQTMLENELKKHGSSVQAVIKSGLLKRVCKGRGFRDAESMLVSLAHGHTSLMELTRELLPEHEWDAPEDNQTTLDKLLKRIRSRNMSPVLISGEEDVLVQFARCCNPLPGDPVAGWITRGRGISVHVRKCPQLLNMDPQRRIRVQWDSAQGGLHTGEIRVVCVDRPGLLANITKTCTDEGINITKAQVLQQVPGDTAECNLEIGVEDVDQLQKLIRRLERIKGVISVDRLGR